MNNSTFLHRRAEARCWISKKYRLVEVRTDNGFLILYVFLLQSSSDACNCLKRLLNQSILLVIVWKK